MWENIKNNLWAGGCQLMDGIGIKGQETILFGLDNV